ncbi:MAG: hypothetical protein FJY54_15370 [Betaproteobacteria bacterium]|nr:hypothetical protein [Betaproteobacteria bacterium]
MRRYRARKKAAGLRPVVRWEPPAESEGRGYFSTHRVLEARSLALHACIARKIASKPSLIGIARKNVEAWREAAGKEPPRHLAEWRRILKRPWRQIAALITEQSERAARLRQSSPFAGVLTAEERKRIYDAFRA